MNAIKEDVISLVDKELKSANEKFPLFNSNHEGYAIILEEIEEADEVMKYIKDTCIEDIWGKIRSNKDATINIKVLHKQAIDLACEAIQVAAMAQKFIDSQKGEV